jgi:hypothetical protein
MSSTLQTPLPPLPTLFEPASSFQDVQGIFDALDLYLAYRSDPSLLLTVQI